MVYLLHGGGGGFRDWSNYSDVAQFAKGGLLLVMPEGASSYYVNSAEIADDRYEDFVVQDLVRDVESRFPVVADRAHRAIIGVSMGGLGAVDLALHHPELYGFAAGLSPALDVPSRPFSIKRVGQWQHYKSIFGDWGSAHRRQNDPYLLLTSANAATLPYLFLRCGDQEGLLPANKRFAHQLGQGHFRFEFHIVHGGHDWNQWNAELPELFKSLFDHLQ